MTEDTHGSLAIYRTVNSTCRSNYCQEARYLSCDGKPLESTCVYNVIEDGNVVEKTGVCEKDVTGWNMCRVKSQKNTKIATKVTEWPETNTN
ncbi:hypothetical protein ATCC90586_012184 [Pythium insidiosum]|nr:hypothetical protein ATCC90586_012184 [Pythium insidiosum]